MQVNKISCNHFRNLEKTEIFPDGGMNVICGENAQGKTNLIEAVWMFTGAKSFRNTKDSAFLKIGEEKGQNEIVFTANGCENESKMIFADKRTAVLNGKNLQNPSKMAGIFNAIVFSPTDLGLIKNGPADRRKFLDLSVGQLYPNFITLLSDYQRAVFQRNQIIKDYKYDPSLAVMLDIFEQKIAQNGKKISGYRKRYLDKLKNFLPEIYSGLSGGREKIECEYLSSCDEELLAEQLKESRKEDMYSGVTGIGAHRDDIGFEINGLSARAYGSQGQQRSIALAVKLAGAEVIKEVSGEYPVCLLDDVMSELDPTRQAYILNHISGWQSFLTCCDPSDTAGLKNGKMFRVKKGKITEISCR